ncbi:aldehyde ferredoxin oxidoreductase [Halostella sp. JP-L12]|uniref:aldehyde ferredoxin oxidoreductase family protein n=1 Tax=Halostella TaxID=1843185 RepID=UPI000EF7BCB7|nr:MULTISPECIES: aldehyde ferredoxin oxidoreductase C-terminal domain-containing protein [Halostella]NHN48936.1 aldehyde ferredoxin oxidoreductase [Halostella sp. JP-L12]
MSHRAPAGLLRVDLSDGTVKSERVPERWRRDYVGGKGLGARYLYEELDPGADPLGPENVLLFMHGPLSAALPGEPRYAAVTKSPLTGTFLDSYSGGEFAERLRGALGDHLGLLVTGRAEEPVRIEIEDGEATVEPTDSWGEDAVATCEAHPDAAVACVGPAGENAVEYATIASDEANHHAGRGGAGAVMGAKRLKAVVVRGDPPDGDDFDDLRDRAAAAYGDAEVGRWQRASGTVESAEFANEVGVLSTRGWQESGFEGTDAIGVEAVRDAATGRENEDADVPGGFRVDTDDGEYVPRGASAMSLGAGLGVDEFDAVAALGETCDRLGVDVISAGSSVAWAVRASETGAIDREFSFGDAESARTLIEEIAGRETPLGDALADGVDAAAERFGGGDLVPTVKAMELPGYDPRGSRAMALAYATSDRGGCHRRARPVEEEVFGDWSDGDRVRAVIAEQDRRSLVWSLVGDDFGGEVLDDLAAEWFAAVGQDRTPEGLRTAGERIWTLVRLFNVREGFDRADDELPPVLTESVDDADGIDPTAFDDLLRRYYAARSWDRRGRPTRALCDRLGLLDTVDDDTPVADAPATPPEQ